MPVGDYVYYDELNATLTSMHDKGLYSKLVFYLEACEAGSMFDGVLSHTRLTVEAIRADGCRVTGVVLNRRPGVGRPFISILGNIRIYELNFPSWKYRDI